MGSDFHHSVAQFYESKSIFITGATGFIGKMLLERLLWNCPKIDKIYILIRERKGKSVDKRMQELFDNVLFSKLKEYRPGDLTKVIPIAGEIGIDDLGISCVDEDILIEKVSIVIHVAATVRFDEPLKQALKINFDGTKQILNLCHRMKILEVLVHTSSAYANTDKKVINEIVYPAPADLNDVFHQVQEKDLDADFSKLLNGRPNTYTFTKALTENLIAEMHGNITTLIIRPSIVTAAANGPVPGWIDNWNGATAILTSVAKGINRFLWGNNRNILDLIPVDYVANLFIVAIAKGQSPKNLVVYNCCSSFNNPITLKDALRMFVEEAVKYKNYIFPLPHIYFIANNRVIESIVTFFLQLLPAFVADFLNLIIGRSTGFMKLQKRLINKRNSLKFFSKNSWLIRNENSRNLFLSLSDEDRKEFPCDATILNWNQYIPIYCAGIRTNLENN